jgi:Na+/H+ antiporter NhaD/arsenite permease-like protein
VTFLNTHVQGRGKGLVEIALASIIFILTYVGIMTEKINRALVACIGGLLMVLFGIAEMDQMFVKHIDWETIALLFSMMIIVSITSRNGVFEYIAVKLAQQVNGRPVPLLVVVSVMTALGSAFLDNVTTVLLLVPIILTLTQMLNVTSIPYLTAVILFANIGGTATLIGDPPNIMIGQAVDHLEFNDFLAHLAPVVVVIYIVILTGFTFYYRDKLRVTARNRNKLMQVDPVGYLKKGPVLVKSVSILSLTIAGFLLHPIFHIDLTTVAMAGALLLVLMTYKEQEVEHIFQSVEWVTLFFFIGLFMLVGGLKEVGLIDEMARGMLYFTAGDLPTMALFILWGSGLLSGFIDNIPFVAAMIPVISEFEDYGITNLDPFWWALALGSCLGGNGTLIGASANVIVAGFAAKHKQPISFIGFMKVGLTVVILSLSISTVYIYFRYLIYFD